MLQLIFGDVFFALLIYRGIHKKAQQHRRGAVNGHRYRGAGVAKIKTRIQFFGIIQRGNAYARLPILP
jgi:hypothetical protein